MTMQREEMEAVGARLEWGGRLGGLVLRRLLSDGDSALWRDEHFLEWLARRTRRRAERMTGPHDAAGADTVTLAASAPPPTLRAACARRFGVRILDGAPRFAPDSGYLVLGGYDNGMAPFLGAGDTLLVHVGGALGRDSMVVVRLGARRFACRRVRRLGRASVRVDDLVPSSGSAVVTTRAAILGPVVAVWCARPSDRS